MQWRLFSKCELWMREIFDKKDRNPLITSRASLNSRRSRCFNVNKLMLGLFVAAVSACTQTATLQSKPTNFGGITLPEITMIENFEGADATSSWDVFELPARPWVEGTVSTGVGMNGSKALAVDYRLACENWKEKRCADVLLLRKKLAAPVEAKAVSFWVNSNTNMAIGMRLQDSAGQWFSYEDVGTQMVSSGDFYRVTVPLEQHQSHWDGPNDGVVRSPIQEIRLLVGGPNHNPFEGSAYTGRIIIDQFEAWKTLPTVATLEVKNASLNKLPFTASVLRTRLAVVNSPDIWSANGPAINAARLDVAKTLGFSFIRADLTWYNVEKNGQYDFSKFDAYLDAAEERGLGVLWVLGYGHPDHSPFKEFPSTPTRDESVAAFVRYVEAAVTRYKGRNVRYEVYNEPDGYEYWRSDPNWTGTEDPNTTARPQSYGRLLRASVEAARRIDPNIIISTGGTTGWKGIHSWLDGLLATDFAAGTNAFAYHFYSRNPERNFAQLARLRTQIGKKYPGKQIWDTEWGYTSDPAGNAQEELNPNGAGNVQRQAVLNVRRMLMAWASDLHLTTVFGLYDTRTDDATAYDSFGLMDINSNEKPAGTAIRILSTIAWSRSLTGIVQGLPVGVNALQLESATDRVHVLWAETKGATFEARVPCGLTVVNMYRENIALSACSGDNGYQTFALEEAKGPVYIFSAK
jgi:polysaccharide biosynthesis protein PslG